MKENYSFQETGKGQPILLLHGFGEDKKIWSDVFKKWDGSARLIALDLPGFGDAPAFKKIPKMADYAAFVVEFCQHMKLKQIVLAGHSMGGYVALEILKSKAMKAAGLVLINSHPYADDLIRKEMRKRAIRLIDTGYTELYLRQLYRSVFTAQFVIQEKAYINDLIDRIAAPKHNGLTHALKAMASREDSSDVLKKIKIPFLMLGGSLDKLLPVVKACEVASMPATARLRLNENVGHMLPSEAPAMVAKELSAFLAQ